MAWNCYYISDIDTVEMQGDGFEYLIKEGQEVVKAGTPLIGFNRQKIKEAGYSDVTVCVITDGAARKNSSFSYRNLRAGK